MERRLTADVACGIFEKNMWPEEHNMHTQSNFKILTQIDNGYIGVCDCCQQYNFVYKNLLIIFLEEELISFLDWLSSNRFSRDYLVTLYHGRNRVYASPHSNLYLAFSDAELDEIAAMTAEVKLILDAQKILTDNR